MKEFLKKSIGFIIAAVLFSAAITGYYYTFDYVFETYDEIPLPSNDDILPTFSEYHFGELEEGFVDKNDTIQLCDSIILYNVHPNFTSGHLTGISFMCNKEDFLNKLLDNEFGKYRDDYDGKSWSDFSYSVIRYTSGLYVYHNSLYYNRVYKTSKLIEDKEISEKTKNCKL